jgi:hypothetical protein
MNTKTRKNYPVIEELPTSMRATEHILPTQFSSPPLEQVTQKKGEFQLLMAILEEAIHCFTTYLMAKKPTTKDYSRRPKSGLTSRTPSGPSPLTTSAWP